MHSETEKIFEKRQKSRRVQRRRQGNKPGWLHFGDNEKFIAPSPAASLNQRTICIADGPCRNEINLSPISQEGLKISASLIYVCIVPWHPEREVTALRLGSILFLHPLRNANILRSLLKGFKHYTFAQLLDSDAISKEAAGSHKWKNLNQLLVHYMCCTCLRLSHNLPKYHQIRLSLSIPFVKYIGLSQR